MFIPDQSKPEKERCIDAVIAIRQWLSTEEIENLAKMITNPEERKTFIYKEFKKRLKS